MALRTGFHSWPRLRRFLNIGMRQVRSGSRPSTTAFAASPDADIAKWKSPVLLIQGDDDRNVPFDQTVELAHRLEQQHTPFEELVIPNEIHGFLRWANWLQADEATVQYLSRQLGTYRLAMNPGDKEPRTLAEYEEYLPPAALADHFVCFWTQTISGSQGVYEHRVLPDACIDIVLVNDEAPIVVGPWTIPLLAQLPVGSSITGARLHPGRASCLLGMPASELLNQTMPMAAVKGAMRNIRLEKVIEQLNAAARRSRPRPSARALAGTFHPVRPGCPGRNPMAFAPSARPYRAVEPLDRDKRASASSEVFGSHRLWPQDVSVSDAIPASS